MKRICDYTKAEFSDSSYGVKRSMHEAEISAQTNGCALSFLETCVASVDLLTDFALFSNNGSRLKTKLSA